MEDERNKGITPRAVRLFVRRVYEIRKTDYFLIRISSNNLHSQHVFEKMGAIKIGEEETDFSKFVEKLKKTVGKEEQNLEKIRVLFGESTDEIVYRYRLNLNIFL